MIKLLDVFAGIGGFHLGIQKASDDFTCVGAIEYNKQARETYIKNFPNTYMFDRFGGDMTKIPMSEIPDHNFLCGGFPCQPFSQSGNAHIYNQGRLIDTDNRTHLYQYLIDILADKSPDYFIFENVEGLTRIMYGGIKLIDHILSLIPKVYHTQVLEISPHEIGVPQIRKRIFIVGTLLGGILPIQIKPQKTPPLSCLLLPKVGDEYNIDNLWRGHYLKKTPNKTKIEALKDSFAYRSKKYPTAHLIPQTKTVLAAEINGDTPNGRSRQRDRAYHINGMCPTLNCTDVKIIYQNGCFRAITPVECARLQCFPDYFIIHTNKSITYQQFGNAVCVEAVRSVAACLLQK